MLGYLDTSVLLRHILLGDPAIEQVFACKQIISSELIEIESKRVLHRYRMEGDLDDGGFVASQERLSEALAGISLLSLSKSIKKRAMEAFPVHINTLDALHIASMLAFTQARPEENLSVFSYDSAMNRCAKALGYSAPFSN